MTLKTTPLKHTKLFESIKVGENELSNRIAFLPTTRYRSLQNHVPSDLQVKYYSQRSQYPGTLVIAEATSISEDAALLPHIPGIWSEEQVAGWKQINHGIHRNGSFSSIQLFAQGRKGDPALLKYRGYDYTSASDVNLSQEAKANAESVGNKLRAMTLEEIDEFINEKFPNAAKKAIEAGFDYVELHGAHGYLFEQFLQPSTNKRVDRYGGSIENRARFLLEVIDKLIETVGAHKVALRISPWTQISGMKGDQEEVHPIVTFSYVLNQLQKRADSGDRLAYISVVEPRFQGFIDTGDNKESEIERKQSLKNNNDFVYDTWDGVVIKGGNYSYDLPDFKSALKDLQNDRTLVGFSRYFISNPDLVNRLKNGYSLEPYNREDFYSRSNWNYSTYVNYEAQNTAIEQNERRIFPQMIKGFRDNLTT